MKIICSDDDLPHLGKEAAILVPNHRYSLDFLTTGKKTRLENRFEMCSVMIPDQFGALGILKAMQKNSIKFMPIIGWNFWFTENIFLARNAQRDIKKIQDGIDELVNSKKPFWMTLYVMDRNIIYNFDSRFFSCQNHLTKSVIDPYKAEGSRFTKAKHEASEEIAKSKNYKSLKHHLQPRPTGFVTVVEQLRQNKVQIHN